MSGVDLWPFPTLDATVPGRTRGDPLAREVGFEIAPNAENPGHLSDAPRGQNIRDTVRVVLK